MSAITDPRPSTQAFKKPCLMPLSICAALMGPIGAASDKPSST